MLYVCEPKSKKQFSVWNFHCAAKWNKSGSHKKHNEANDQLFFGVKWPSDYNATRINHKLVNSE